MKLRKIRRNAETSGIAPKTTDSGSGSDKFFAVAFVGIVLRVLVPVMGFFLVGLLIDALRGQPAFFAFVGVMLGFAIAIFLLYLQYKDMDTNLTKTIFSSEDNQPRKPSASSKLRMDNRK
jgi:hypothetical protein